MVRCPLSGPDPDGLVRCPLSGPDPDGYNSFLSVVDESINRFK